MISVAAGSAGIYQYAWIYDAYGRYMSYMKLPCNNYKCYGSVNATFTIPISWQAGEYYLMIYDFFKADYTKVSFTVGAAPAIQKKSLSFTLAPASVKRGNNLIINVTPGTKGVYYYVWVYNSTHYKTGVFLPCGYWKCYEPLSVKLTIPVSWSPGNYYASVYDYSEPDYRYAWKKLYFSVTA